MSAGGARRGRRDNGLDAADFAAAGDVDPRVGEHLLDVLAAGGIAAYLQPSADRDPILRATTFPATPTDRLYVDRVHLDTAREHLQKLIGGSAATPAPWPDPTADPAPGSSPAGAVSAPGATGGRTGTPPGGEQSDVDAEWARIVAGFHTAVDPAAPPWPEAEGIDPARAAAPPAPPADPAPPGTEVRHNRRRTDREPGLLDGLDTFGADLPGDDDDEDERYVPPPPPPLPHVSKYAIAGVLGVVVGFVLFLFPTLLPIEARIVNLMGFAAIVAGAVTLVWRLRSGDDDDEDDDGAVV